MNNENSNVFNIVCMNRALGSAKNRSSYCGGKDWDVPIW